MKSKKVRQNDAPYITKKLALIAVARKLLVIACAILNSQKPYEENHISCYNKNSVKIA